MLILTSSANQVTPAFLKYLPKNPTTVRVTFIPTAAEVETGTLQWLKDDRQALVTAGFQVTDFTLSNKTITDIEAMLQTTDCLFVSGGNTFYLLQQMRKCGFDQLIPAYLNKGLNYIGSSAGSVVAGTEIGLVQDFDKNSLAPELIDYQGLNLIDISILPHWGNEHFRTKYDQAMKSIYASNSKVILLRDNQYLLVEGNKYRLESI